MNRKKKFEWYGVIRVDGGHSDRSSDCGGDYFCSGGRSRDSALQIPAGTIFDKRNFFNVIETMIPLVFCGLAINVMHKSGLFSMVADSSFYFAGVMAATLAIACPMPNILHQIVILAVAMAVGGVIGIIPVLIKRKTGANELVISDDELYLL